MEVYRLARKKFGKKLSGAGAALYGARWNSQGVELIYTAANRSLAMAEVAVHLSLASLPPDYYMMTIKVPDSASIKLVVTKRLPKDWNQFPHPVSTRRVGDKFVQDGKHLLLKVPSAVTKGDFNILINPHHPDFKMVRISEWEKFPFDNRIFK